jgi:hypothetical protein
MRLMKQRLATALVLACAGLFAQTVGAAQPVSIGNYGEDGEGVFYGVICDDNSEGSVVQRIEPPRQICATPAFGAESCRGGWTVNEAAVYACQANTGSANNASGESSAATGIAGSASARAAQPAKSQRHIRVKKNSAGRPVPNSR